MYVLQLSTCVYTCVNLVWIFQFFSIFKLTKNTFEMMPRIFYFSKKDYREVFGYDYTWTITKRQQISVKNKIKLEISPLWFHNISLMI